jgi:FKBP-type peptidyl-prolyl cis-trans isomerase SlyD
MTIEQIQPGDVVTFHYVLYADGAEALDDSAARGVPARGIVGTGFLLPGLEEALIGKRVGQTFDLTLPPEKAWGERRGAPLPVPRAALPDDADLVVGGTFETRTPDGRPMLLWVVRIDDDQVWLDPHHPLAGRTLRYVVRLLDARPATAEERASGRPSDDGHLN